MDKFKNTILIALLMAVGPTIPIRAEKANIDEALTVANNWINIIIRKKGSWGDANIAYVEDIQEFKRGNRILGYFCHVKPVGHVILSLHKQLAPVKAYSATCNLDPESEVGMVELLKDNMERIHNGINQWATRMKASPDEAMENLLEINYRNAWNKLNVDTLSLQQKLESDIEPMNYQSGQILLTSSWHQDDPYNRTCPLASGSCTATRCLVGCVATAGAQIMRYWNWPPYGEGMPYSDFYDWVNMPDSVTGSSTTDQINAVSELCSEVGQAVGMLYCSDECQSGANTWDMEGVFENHYRYHTACAKRDRKDYNTATDWFSLIQSELNANRPLQYRILGHSIVCDGWQIVGIQKQYHMNYGWDNFYNTWYTLDALYYPAGGSTSDEYVLENIYPAQSLQSSLSGTYPRDASFYYRYFNVDATGNYATFDGGQYLQFLPDITVTCTSTTGGSIRFNGSSSYTSRLFSRGDTTKGARLYGGGTIKIHRYGSIKFE